MNGLVTVLQLLFHYIDTTFSLKQYQVRLMKGILSIPFITWVCFILGSRIVGPYSLIYLSLIIVIVLKM